MKAANSILMGLAVAVVFDFSAVSLMAAPPKKEEIVAANKAAAKLQALDDRARHLFSVTHPGVLPEQHQPTSDPKVIAFDWTNLNVVFESHHQLTGDCWANSSTEALECSNTIRNGHRYMFSPQPVLDALKVGASEEQMGCQPFRALDFFMKTGTARLADYAYTGKPETITNTNLPFRAVAWGFVAQDDGSSPTPELIKAALLKHGPLVVDLTATKTFEHYTGGVFNQPIIDKNDDAGQHAVLLVGWDDSRGPNGAWKIKNSWGTKWGEAGFAWVAYGSNTICSHVEWVMAESTYYNIPHEAFAKLVPDAKPLHTVHEVAANKTTELAEKTAAKPATKPAAKIADSANPVHFTQVAANSN